MTRIRPQKLAHIVYRTYRFKEMLAWYQLVFDAEVQMQNESGEAKTFYVTKIEDQKLTVDGNHPLAGKALKVQVKILEVRDATIEDCTPTGGSCSLN